MVLLSFLYTVFTGIVLVVVDLLVCLIIATLITACCKLIAHVS